MDRKYWDDVYQVKTEDQVSWFQEHPTRSLELIVELGLKPDDSIIDIGGGDSRLVDHLLDRGFTDVSILDISEMALEKARARLAGRGGAVNFIRSDIVQFQPSRAYKLWHDRATFHFLTKLDDVETYLEIASRSLQDDGCLIISTFSKNGPEKCSGLRVSRYSETSLKALFGKSFVNVRCFYDTHLTPGGVEQDFVFCGFRKRA